MLKHADDLAEFPGWAIFSLGMICVRFPALGWALFLAPILWVLL